MIFVIFFAEKDMSDFGRARRRRTQTCSLSTLPHPLATCASLPPNHHKWSANSSITSKNSSKKSTFSPCVLVVTHPRPPLDPPLSTVEAGCQRTRDQGHPQISHTKPRRLPQVSLPTCPQSATHIPQIQQALWRTPLLRTPSLHAPPARPLSRADARPAARQAL